MTNIKNGMRPILNLQQAYELKMAEMNGMGCDKSWLKSSRS